MRAGRSRARRLAQEASKLAARSLPEPVAGPEPAILVNGGDGQHVVRNDRYSKANKDAAKLKRKIDALEREAKPLGIKLTVVYGPPQKRGISTPCP